MPTTLHLHTEARLHLAAAHGAVQVLQQSSTAWAGTHVPARLQHHACCSLPADHTLRALITAQSKCQGSPQARDVVIALLATLLAVFLCCFAIHKP